MKIRIVLEVDDPGDEDATHSTGLTAEAYDRLADALSGAGFGIADGPEQERT